MARHTPRRCPVYKNKKAVWEYSGGKEFKLRMAWGVPIPDVLKPEITDAQQHQLDIMKERLKEKGAYRDSYDK
jgi:hypothetical protein